MSNVRAIRNEEDYQAAMARLGEIFQAGNGAPEATERDILFGLVEDYENRRHPIEYPSVAGAIEFYIEQGRFTRRDLIPIIGGRAKVSELLSGKRDITMSMARALHKHLGIPAHILLREPGASFPDAPPDLEFTRFPLKSMAKRGWIPDVQDLKDSAEELIVGLMERAGGREFAAAPLYRKNDSRRVNAKTDDYALRAWCWQVLAQARDRRPPAKGQAGGLDSQLLRQVAKFSVLENGPAQAGEFLAQRGVGLEYVSHLPKTHLDGAALRLPDGRPVIGLTLRYDRIDNFWFTLLHELAHVVLHLGDSSDEVGFVDDLSLRGVESSGSDAKEQEADRLAQDSLIPPEIWDDGAILENPGPMPVLEMAWEAQVHPAIIAGRVRHESGNYRLLSQFVGTGAVRRQAEAHRLGFGKGG